MLDWEENLFLGLKALHRRLFLRPREARRSAVRATLEPRRNALRLLAGMIAGREVGMLETVDPSLCGNNRIFLPPEMAAASTPELNSEFYTLRTIVAALAIRQGWHQNGTPLSTLVDDCREEFPELHAWLLRFFASLPPNADPWSTLGTLPISCTQAPGPSVPRLEPVPPVPSPASVTATQIEGQGRGEVEVKAAKGDDGVGADLPTHTFEKVETLEEYTGQSRKSDGSDELAEHAEALSELKMTQLLRSPERPQSIYRSDVILEGWGAEEADPRRGGGIPYPEWDYARKAYRPDWCFVEESEPTQSIPSWVSQTERTHRLLIQKLRRQFHSLTSDWLRLRRQPSGSEFDLDAVVESETERRTGRTPVESIYLHRKRDLHDIAALVLLDVSYSTDAWVANQRVLDVIRETVFCVGEVLEDYVEQFGLAAFSSNTRRACSFEVIKPLAFPWRAARGRLGSLEARGYTRIGPALRHAQELLSDVGASRKIVILVTDGRPCDYDRYEGKYGLMDVRKAIETGQQQGIHTHAFAVEKRAAESLPQMFSRHRFDIVPRPEVLGSVMCKLFARLLSG